MDIDEKALSYLGLTPYTINFWEEQGLFIYKMFSPDAPMHDLMVKLINEYEVPRENLRILTFNEIALVLIEYIANTFEKFIHQFKLPYSEMDHEENIKIVAPPETITNIMLQEQNIMQFELPNWIDKGLLFYNLRKTKGLTPFQFKQKIMYLLDCIRLEKDKLDTIKIIILQGDHIAVQETVHGAFNIFQRAKKIKFMDIVHKTIS